jgi:hypothetical protein
MSKIILMGQTLLDYRYTEPILEIPITGKLLTWNRPEQIWYSKLSTTRNSSMIPQTVSSK